jgi:broad specificity phosphatase PhoE
VSSTEIVLVRHGHTISNSGGTSTPLTGWSDIPLTDIGRQEADKLALRLAGCRWSAIFSSSSRRALDTAERALSNSGRALIHVLDELREIHCGDLEGWPVEVVKCERPELWRDNEREDDPNFRWPGGESYAEFRARSLGVVTRIANAHPSGRVLVFTHAGFVSQIVGSLNDVNPARWSCFRPHTCSLTEVVWGDRRALVRFDDREHLVARG